MNVGEGNHSETSDIHGTENTFLWNSARKISGAQARARADSQKCPLRSGAPTRKSPRNTDPKDNWEASAYPEIRIADTWDPRAQKLRPEKGTPITAVAVRSTPQGRVSKSRPVVLDVTVNRRGKSLVFTNRKYNGKEQ